MDFTEFLYLWKNNQTEKPESFTTFKLASIEMIRRRNKPNDNCLSESTSYDVFKVKKAVENLGCKAPYQNLDYDVPFCNYNENLSIFNEIVLNQEKFPPPCVEIPQVSFELSKIGAGRTFGFYPLHVVYPKHMKLITQQQALDIHALIGNIGGYIGLFLGMFEIMESFELSLPY